MPRQGSDDKRRINLIPVETSTHLMLLRVANERGMSVQEFAGLVIDEWAMTAETPVEDSEDRQFFWLYVEMIRHRWKRQALYKMAASYAEYPTETGADMLQRACDLAGVDYEDLILKVQHDPFSSIVAASRQGTKFDACLQWLTELLMREGRAPVAALKQQAEIDGYAWTMVERVKRHIQSSPEIDVTIESVKEGKGWAWNVVEKHPEREPEPVEEEEHAGKGRG